MPADYQPPPFSMMNIRPSFRAVCDQMLRQPGRSIVYWRIRDFQKGMLVDFDPYEVGIELSRLQHQGVLVDYGTYMDENTSSDYIIIEGN